MPSALNGRIIEHSNPCTIMARILLATDLSEQAMHAACYAVELFGPTNTFVLLHTYVEDLMLLGKGEEEAKAAASGLHEHAERFLRATGLESVQRQVRIGQVASVLGEVVQKREVDLVVMGNRGAAGSTFFFGSNTAQVIKSSLVPALAVPESAGIQRPKRILLAADQGTTEPGDLHMLRHIAQMSDAEVLLCHVSTETAPGRAIANAEVYERALKDIPHSFHHAQAEDLIDGLGQLARSERADMIAVLHRHVGFLGRLLHPSASKVVAERIELPLLVLQQVAE